MSADPIVLLGGGGHALDVANAIERSLGWESIVGYLDDQPSDRMAGWEISHLGELSTSDISGKRIILAIGFPSSRQTVLQKFDGQDFVSVMVVDPDCTVGRNVSIGAGSPVLAGARLSSNSSIGEHSIVHQNVTIGHDTVLKSHACAMPGSNIGGDCSVGFGRWSGPAPRSSKG